MHKWRCVNECPLVGKSSIYVVYGHSAGGDSLCARPWKYWPVETRVTSDLTQLKQRKKHINGYESLLSNLGIFPRTNQWRHWWNESPLSNVTRFLSIGHENVSIMFTAQTTNKYHTKVDYCASVQVHHFTALAMCILVGNFLVSSTMWWP